MISGKWKVRVVVPRDTAFLPYAHSRRLCDKTNSNFVRFADTSVQSECTRLFTAELFDGLQATAQVSSCSRENARLSRFCGNSVCDVSRAVNVVVRKEMQCNFYRATLCVSAVFAVDRCPSVRPSVTFVYCIQTAKDVVKLLSHPGSTIILLF